MLGSVQCWYVSILALILLRERERVHRHLLQLCLFSRFCNSWGWLEQFNWNLCASQFGESKLVLFFYLPDGGSVNLKRIKQPPIGRVEKDERGERERRFKEGAETWRCREEGVKRIWDWWGERERESISNKRRVIWELSERCVAFVPPYMEYWNTFHVLGLKKSTFQIHEHKKM